MFQLYLLLRLKNFGRIVIELGIFRIVFLTILTVAAIMILFLAENPFRYSCGMRSLISRLS